MLRKMLSLWLAFAMIFTTMPLNAFAEETSAEPAAVETVAEAPAAKEEAPAAKEEAPAAKEEAPAAKEEAPAAKEEAPAAKAEAPAAKEEAPAPKEEAPAATEETPAATEETPAATEETPAATEETPATTEDTPAAKEETPAATEETPATTEDPPAATEETPATTEEAPAATEEAPVPEKSEAPAFDLAALLHDAAALRAAAKTSDALTIKAEALPLTAGEAGVAIAAELANAPQDVTADMLTWVLLPVNGAPELTAAEKGMSVTYTAGALNAGVYAYDVVCAVEDGRMGIARVEVTAAEPAVTEEPAESETAEPTEEPAEDEAAVPTEEPAEGETAEPTEEPAEGETAEPTEEPAEGETAEPTEEPAEGENAEPTEEPAEENAAELLAETGTDGDFNIEWTTDIDCLYYDDSKGYNSCTLVFIRDPFIEEDIDDYQVSMDVTGPATVEYTEIWSDGSGYVNLRLRDAGDVGYTITVSVPELGQSATKSGTLKIQELPGSMPSNATTVVEDYNNQVKVGDTVKLPELVYRDGTKVDRSQFYVSVHAVDGWIVDEDEYTVTFEKAETGTIYISYDYGNGAYEYGFQVHYVAVAEEADVKDTPIVLEFPYDDFTPDLESAITNNAISDRYDVGQEFVIKGAVGTPVVNVVTDPGCTYYYYSYYETYAGRTMHSVRFEADKAGTYSYTITVSDSLGRMSEPVTGTLKVVEAPADMPSADTVHLEAYDSNISVNQTVPLPQLLYKDNTPVDRNKYQLWSLLWDGELDEENNTITFFKPGRHTARISYDYMNLTYSVQLIYNVKDENGDTPVVIDSSMDKFYNIQGIYRPAAAQAIDNVVTVYLAVDVGLKDGENVVWSLSDVKGGKLELYDPFDLQDLRRIRVTSVDAGAKEITAKVCYEVSGVYKGSTKIRIPVYDQKKLQIAELTCKPNDVTRAVTDADRLLAQAKMVEAYDWVPNYSMVDGKAVFTEEAKTTLMLKDQFGTLFALVKLKVEAEAEADAPTADKLTLEQTEVRLYPDGVLQLTPIATVKGEPTAASPIKWTSSNNAVVTVDADGWLKAVKPGAATITAVYNKGGVTLRATCKVTVCVVPAAVTLKYGGAELERVYLHKGEKAVLTAVVTDSNGKQLQTDMGTWKSNNPEAVTVDAKGNLTALEAYQSADITYTTENGLSAQIYVYVHAVIDKAELNATAVTLGAGETFELELLRIVDTDGNAMTRTGHWESSNPSVVSVTQKVEMEDEDLDGKLQCIKRCTLDALKPGKATIYYVYDSSFKIECAVTVIVAPTKLTLDSTEVQMFVGETSKLVASVYAGRALNKNYRVTWESDTPSVVDVNENGELVAVGVGEAKVTVSTYNGLVAEAIVHVNSAPAEADFQMDSLLVCKGETILPLELLTVTDADNGMIQDLTRVKATWKVTDENGEENAEIITKTLNRDGSLKQLTAKKVGKAILVYTAFNGVETSLPITVQNAPNTVQILKDDTPVSALMTAAGMQPIRLRAEVYGDFKKTEMLKDIRGEWSLTGSVGASLEAQEDGTALLFLPETIARKSVVTVNYTTYNKRVGRCRVTIQLAPNILRLNESEVTMGVAETGKRLSYTALNNKIVILDAPADWSVDPESGLEVAADGTLMAAKAGKYVVTCTLYTGQQGTVDVTVHGEPHSVAFAEPAITTFRGSKLSPEVVVRDEADNVIDVDVSGKLWIDPADKSKILTMNAKTGEIIANRMGVAKVFFTTYNGLTAEQSVTVRNAPVNVGISLSDADEPEFITAYTMSVGETLQLYQHVYETAKRSLASKLTGVEGEWKSAKDTILTVSENGLVEAKAIGTTVISYKTYNNRVGNVRITVQPAPESITLTPKESKLGEGETLTLSMSLVAKDARGRDKALKPVSGTWSSSSPETAAVINGVVTAKTVPAGKVSETVEITFKSYNGVESSVATVTVYRLPVAEQSSLRMTYADSETTLNKLDNGSYEMSASLKATVLPVLKDASGNDAYAQYRLTSTNIRVLVVEKDGKTVTAKRDGEAELVLSFDGQTVTQKVTVTKAPDKLLNVPSAMTIVLDGADQTVQLLPKVNNGAVTTFTYSVTPKTTKLLSVDANGLVTIPAGGSGFATVTVKTHNNRIANVKFTVVDNNVETTTTELMVSTTTKYADSAKRIGVGDTFKLLPGAKMFVTMNNGRVTTKLYHNVSVEWSASSDCVSVSPDGTVTGLSVGTARITATQGSLSATFDVTVSAKPVKGEMQTALSKGMKIDLKDTKWLKLYGEGGAEDAYSITTTYSLPTKAEDPMNYAKCAAYLTVSKTGTLTVRRNASKTDVEVYFNVTANGDTFKVPVTILPAVPDQLVLTDAELPANTTQTEKKVFSGGTYSMSVKVSNDAPTSITYTSSNNRLATVDANGMVTILPNAKGRVTITAKTHNSRIAKVMLIIVEPESKLEVK